MSSVPRLALAGAGGLFLLAWLLPNHYLPWLVAYSELASFLAVVVLGVVLLWQGAKLTLTALSVLLLAMVPLLQGGAGLIYFAGDAAMAVIYLLGFAAALTVGYGLGRDSDVRNYTLGFLAGVLVLAAVLSVWIALRQWLLLSGVIWEAELRPGGRPFANFAQPNSLATLLCMGVAAALYLFERRLVGVGVASLLALVLIFGIALTQSRTPWVGAICALFWWWWKGRSVALRLPVTGFAAWVGMYVVAVLSLQTLAEFLFLSSASLSERAQGMQRLDLWWQFSQAVMHGPLWGYGWTQVSVAQVGVAVDYPVPLMTEHAHNILLDLLLWNGPVLGGLIVLLSALWLVRLARHAVTRESVFALLAVGFVLVHGMLEFPLEYAFFLFPVGLLLGLVEADQQTPAVVSVPRWVSVGALVSSMVMLGWVGYEYRVIEEDHRLMQFESARIGNLKAEQKAPDVLVLTQLREFIRFSRTKPYAGMAAHELDRMRKVAHRYPNAPNLFRYALALGLNGSPAAAYEQMLVLRSLHGDELYDEGRIALQAMLGEDPQLGDVLARLPETGFR